VYALEYTNRFKKDLKRCNKRGYNLGELIKVIDLLQRTGELPAMYKPHLLKGKYTGLWECHIKPDWLLIWHQDNSSLTLLMMNTGTHSDLF
jgi:mRNA interferase YafQ